ncbi:DUF418 domain-containing protein [Actinomyces urogenitalis]|uniref:DUF418 domain-containing protein n=1 Tax=Actinomyces urogenitalis TaxID=103621 RepID=UPI0024320A7D|nr:DUF418 domain-containing protein [Actinomyces urogenitalis]MCI7456196.1 DUF418 domain-containing protein [Actinomyces urogenitalis]
MLQRQSPTSPPSTRPSDAAARQPQALGHGAAAPSRPRIIGLDIARALALAGMVSAHLISIDGPVAMLTSGFPAGLFALLAGTSLALMSERGVARGGTTLARSRHSLIVRGVLLVVLHQLLAPWSGSIQVVLEVFGMAYIAMACVPRWRTSTLWQLLVWLVLGSALVKIVGSSITLPGVFSFPYPLMAWMAYMTVGLLVHRLLTTSPRRQLLVLLVAAPVTAAGIVLRERVQVGYPTGESASPSSLLPVALDPGAHTGGLADVVMTTAGSLSVVCLCLLLFRRQAWWSFPLQAMGSMSLTVYTAHILTAGPTLSAHGLGTYPALGYATVALALVLPTLLRLTWSRGPLEELMRRLTRIATNPELPPRQVNHSARS